MFPLCFFEHPYHPFLHDINVHSNKLCQFSSLTCLVCNIIILYPLFSCCIWLPSQWAVVVVSLPLSLFLYCHRLRCFINVLNIYLFTCSISVLKELCNWFWNKHTLAHSSTHTLPKRVAVLLPLSFSSAVRGPHTPTGSTVLCYCEMWML